MDSLDPAKLVFIDETCVKTNFVRMYGRAPRGKRVVGEAPRGKWKSLTFVAALRQDGVEAPYAFDGAMNGEIFVAYLEKAVIPTLSPGDLVIVDNLSSHKVAKAREVIEKAGASLVFLPSYSHDYNPIEHFFSKLKQLLRGAARRCVASLRKAIAEILETVAPCECLNYFHHVGYGLPKSK